MALGLKYYFAPFATSANALACLEGRRGRGLSVIVPNYKNFPNGIQNYEHVFCKASRGSPRLVRG